MGVLLATTFGLVLWVTLWALDVNALDGFILTLGIVVTAAAARVLWPFLPGNRMEERGPRKTPLG